MLAHHGICLHGDGALRQPLHQPGCDHGLVGDGPDTHEDPAKRWLVAWPYLVLYVAVGLAAALLVQILGALPAALITTIVGLALFSPLMGSVVAMLKETRDIESALITFLVTASGIMFYGVGSAFWGLVAGLVLFGARHLVKR